MYRVSMGEGGVGFVCRWFQWSTEKETHYIQYMYSSLEGQTAKLNRSCLIHNLSPTHQMHHLHNRHLPSSSLQGILFHCVHQIELSRRDFNGVLKPDLSLPPIEGGMRSNVHILLVLYLILPLLPVISLLCGILL